MSIAIEHVANVPTEPGLYYDVSFEEYRQWDYCSQSRLTILRDSTPAHLLDEMRNPRPCTPATRLGDAAHRAILQPDLFESEFVRGIEGDGRTKAVREARQALEAEHPGSIILLPDEYDRALRMRDAVWEHPKASQLLTDIVEVSAVWQDTATGVMCKGRFDCINRDISALIDVKTTRDASKRAFQNAVGSYGYYLQGGFYNQGAHILGEEIKHFIFIAVESENPSKERVAVYRLMDKALEAAEYEIGDLMQVYKQALESGYWHGYSEEIEDIGVPGWVIYNIEERTGVELT